ncbi:hypothetical protein FRB97_008222 [Tulasnella sp. 331]|nr:hypothetical protein FRB97_008222 [Tulasnella sp. 331]
MLRLESPIVFTAKDQEISTAGYPNDDGRAILIVTGERLATAIHGDCKRCAGVKVRSLIIDGNRRYLGRVSSGGPLLAIGNAQEQVVERCKLFDPRGGSALHIREGDGLRCGGARVENNHIGPSGEEWDEEIDGPEPELSPLGSPFGDGIRVACKDSIIRNNIIADATGIGIIAFAPGIEILSNEVTMRQQVSVGGIFLVAPDPFGGNYTSTVIKGNILSSTGPKGYMRVGIGAGAPIWADDHQNVLYNGSIVGNSIVGDSFGYGVAVAGVSGFVVEENVSQGEYWGVVTNRCARGPPNHPPTGFVHDLESSAGVFQRDFVPGVISFRASIDHAGYNTSGADCIGLVTCIESRERQKVTTKPELGAPEGKNKKVAAPPKPMVWETMLKHSEDRISRMILEISAKLQIPGQEGIVNYVYGDYSAVDGVGALKQSAEQQNAFEQVSERLALLEVEGELIMQIVESVEVSIESLKTRLLLQTSLGSGKVLLQNLTTATVSNTVTLQLLVALQFLVILALLYVKRIQPRRRPYTVKQGALYEGKQRVVQQQQVTRLIASLGTKGSGSSKKPPCLAGTRVALLQKIDQGIEVRIGKSSIGVNVAKQQRVFQRLGAEFYFMAD